MSLQGGNQHMLRCRGEHSWLAAVAVALCGGRSQAQCKEELLVAGGGRPAPPACPRVPPKVPTTLESSPPGLPLHLCAAAGRCLGHPPVVAMQPKAPTIMGAGREQYSESMSGRHCTAFSSLAKQVGSTLLHTA